MLVQSPKGSCIEEKVDILIQILKILKQINTPLLVAFGPCETRNSIGTIVFHSMLIKQQNPNQFTKKMCSSSSVWILLKL